MQEISLHILDIFQNSTAAGANLITIEIQTDSINQTLSVIIRDNGRGMTVAELTKCFDPFYTTRTTRKIGLGIPLFKMAAELTGGSFEMDSEPGNGTNIRALFKTDHIDCVPLGDINSTILILIRFADNYNIVYKRITDGILFELDTRLLRELLDDVALSTPEVTQFLRNYLYEHSPDVYPNSNVGCEIDE